MVIVDNIVEVLADGDDTGELGVAELRIVVVLRSVVVLVET